MKIMISAEGVTDAGWDDWTGGDFKANQGPIQVYITRILEVSGFPSDNIEFIKYDRKIEKKKRKSRDHFTHYGKAVMGARGHGQEAAIMRAAASREKCAAAVFHVDSDRPAGDANDWTVCNKHFCEVRAEILTGFDDGKNGCFLIPCVPVKMMESWLLADENAIIAVSPKPNQMVKNIAPKKPELLWGDKKNSSSNYPKRVLERVLAEYGLSYNRSTMADISYEQDLDLVKERCEISFQPFYEDILAFAGKWSDAADGGEDS